MSQSATPEQFSNAVAPEGWDPIREDEFERLPEYAVELITQSMNGVLDNVTREQLEASMRNFFENSSNVQNLSASLELINQENECRGGGNSPACGEIHSFEQ